MHDNLKLIGGYAAMLPDEAEEQRNSPHHNWRPHTDGRKRSFDRYG
jgi:hypothetical protein